MSKRKICVVTGSRAEYGLLFCVMKKIQVDLGLQLQIIVTGMHLAPEFGLTYHVIQEDGFAIDAKVEMLLSSDTTTGITKSIGLGIISFAEVLERLKPDILVVLGDRYEILAAVEAALVARVPVAHIAGGDITEGAFDESIRHCITKMSHLHFVTNQDAYERVRQMGENPKYIHNVGSPGIDYILKLKLFDRLELEQKLKFRFKQKNLLVTFHPETLSENNSQKHCAELLKALNRFQDIGIIFTKSNADTGGRAINKMIEEYVNTNSNAQVYTSLGQVLYLSLIAQVDAVVGNSSSGLYEVPTFKKPTVNIGDRQKGRLRAKSVIDCNLCANDIENAINEAFFKDCSLVVNPYGDGQTSDRIVTVLKNTVDLSALIKKKFFMVT